MSGAEVVIVGGGIVGCATAYYLSRKHVRALIVERDALAAHASGFAYGGLNPLAGAGIPGPMFPLAQKSFELHERLAEEFEVGFRKRPVLHLAFSETEAATFDDDIRWANAQRGFRAERLTGAQARRLEPRLAEDVAAASLLHGTAEVDPAALCKALAPASAAEVRIAAALGLERRGDRAIGVRTDDGVIPCDAVVLAQGPWFDAPSWTDETDDPAAAVTPLKGEILRLATSGAPIAYSIGWRGNYMTTKADGLVWAGTTEQRTGFDATPSAAGREAILRHVERVMPRLEAVKVVRQTACLRPMSANGMVVLGRAANATNVYVANGGGRKGVLYGPAMGSAVADLVTARPKGRV